MSPLRENRLLAALPPKDFAKLTARMIDVNIAYKQSLLKKGGPLDYVYFPRSGFLSVVVTMLGGETVEAAVIGYEGMVGVAVALGAEQSSEEVFCQLAPCSARRMPANEFAAEVRKGGRLQAVIHRYTRAMLSTTARLVACNGLHTIEERCARWLLMSRDRVGADVYPLTQEFLATMLGVRRPSVTVAAGALQSAGLITYRHGRVTILDREGLEESACECYAVVRDEFNHKVD